MYLLFIYGAVRHGFEACNIHNEGHWKGWALEIETLLGPEMATSKANAIWAKEYLQKLKKLIFYVKRKLATFQHVDGCFCL
jgi:hypothetical protein